MNEVNKIEQEMTAMIEAKDKTIDGLEGEVETMLEEIKDQQTTIRVLAQENAKFQRELNDVMDARAEYVKMNEKMWKEAQRLRFKIEQDADIKRKLMLQIKELSGDVVLLDGNGRVKA